MEEYAKTSTRGQKITQLQKTRTRISSNKPQHKGIIANVSKTTITIKSSQTLINKEEIE